MTILSGIGGARYRAMRGFGAGPPVPGLYGGSLLQSEEEMSLIRPDVITSDLNGFVGACPDASPVFLAKSY
jgi:hypothetical protein